MAEGTPAGSRLFIPIKEVAEQLSVTPWQVYKWADQGILDSRYQGRRRYITAESLQAYVASLSSTPPERDAT